MLERIVNDRGERLDFALHPGAPGSKRIVVIGHGVTGHKDRPFLVALAEGLARAGIAALRVSWSGNGASQGTFADSCITKEVADLGAVIDAVAREGYEVTYAGHSMGGAVGVLRASEDARVRRLISLAGMVHVHAFAEHHFGRLVAGRDLMWGKPDCVLSPTYVEDLRRIGSVVDRAGKISVPWLLVHGTADTIVPIRDTHDIERAARTAGRNPRKVVIEGCDHVWEPGHTARMVETVVKWMAG